MQIDDIDKKDCSACCMINKHVQDETNPQIGPYQQLLRKKVPDNPGAH